MRGAPRDYELTLGDLDFIQNDLFNESLILMREDGKLGLPFTDAKMIYEHEEQKASRLWR